MVQRAERIAEFTCDQPPADGVQVQILCEDHVGTYMLSFLCLWTDAGWANAATMDCVGADVLGWRLPQVPTWSSHRERGP